VAQLGAEADPAELLARIRGEDGCMRLDDGRLLVMLPATGPAQARALGERLGAQALTEAAWGETAAACWLGLELQVPALRLGRRGQAGDGRQRGGQVDHFGAFLHLALADVARPQNSRGTWVS
jgi:GGDEF domain-containing protein